MEERQKDPSFAEAKDALDLNKDDPGASTAPAGQEQGQCSILKTSLTHASATCIVV